MKPAEIRAITFDVGNTLIVPRVPVGQTYAEIASAHGASGLVASDIERRFRSAFRDHGGAVNTREEWSRIVDTTFDGLVTRRPSESFFAELFDYYARPEAWRVYDDVLPTLQNLSQRGLRLGVISNWDSRLRPLLDVLKLTRYFEVIVISCEVGVAKPARKIFETAANAFKLSPEQILHIGDGIEADVRGAQAVGFQALRIDRDARPEAGVICSLSEAVPTGLAG